MSKMYTKPGRGNEKFLYDSNGKCVGRGVTDKNGKTIYSGAGGYIGKSYTTPAGTVKHFDSNNNYVGTGINRSGVSPIVGNDPKPENTSRTVSGERSEKEKIKEAVGLVSLGIIIFCILIAIFS